MLSMVLENPSPFIVTPHFQLCFLEYLGFTSVTVFSAFENNPSPQIKTGLTSGSSPSSHGCCEYLSFSVALCWCFSSTTPGYSRDSHTQNPAFTGRPSSRGQAKRKRSGKKS